MGDDTYFYEAKNVRLLKRAVDGLHDGTCAASVELGGLNVRAGGACKLAVALKASRAATLLNLADNQIGDDGATALAGALFANSSLTSLGLRACRVGDAGAHALAAALARNVSLRTLSLRSNELTEDGVAALAKALEHNRSLTAIDLRKNFIAGGHDVMDLLERRLALNRLGGLTQQLQLGGEGALTALDLRGDALPPEQRLGNEGACALCRALSQNSRLTSLRLWSNGVGDSGACALAELLRGGFDNSSGVCGGGFQRQGAGATLTSIGLQDNAIGDEGARALADALSCHRAPGFSRAGSAKQGEDEGWTPEPPLLELRLWNNEVTSDGAAAFAACLQQRPIASAGDAPLANTGAAAAASAEGELPPLRSPGNGTLRTLDLRSNRVGGAGVEPLLTALRASFSLVTVALGGNVGVEAETASAASLAAFTAVRAQLARNRLPLCTRLGGALGVLPDETLGSMRLRPWQRRTVGIGLLSESSISSSTSTSTSGSTSSFFRSQAKGQAVGTAALQGRTPRSPSTADRVRPSRLSCRAALAAICDALRGNCTLRSLDLGSWAAALAEEVCGATSSDSGNGGGSYGFGAGGPADGDELVKALARSFGAPAGEGALRGLQRLNLSGNRISWRAGAELVAALQQQQERMLEEREAREPWVRQQQQQQEVVVEEEEKRGERESPCASAGRNAAPPAADAGVAGAVLAVAPLPVPSSLPPPHPALPCRVAVWWEGEEEWFDGTAVAYRGGMAAAGLHVLYDDGDEDFDLPWLGTRLKWLEEGWEEEEWPGVVAKAKTGTGASAAATAVPLALLPVAAPPVTKITHPCCRCAAYSDGAIDPSDPGAGAGVGLRVLLLRDNSFGDDGARALLRLLRGDHGTGGKALPPYTSLTELDLRGNGVSDRLMQEVAEALAWNRWAPLLRTLRCNGGGGDDDSGAGSVDGQGALMCAAARLEAAGGSLCGVDAPARGFGGGDASSAVAITVARGGYERNVVEPCRRVLCAPDCGVGDTLCAELVDALLGGLGSSPPQTQHPTVGVQRPMGDDEKDGHTSTHPARAAADIDALELPMNFVGDAACVDLARFLLTREATAREVAQATAGGGDEHKGGEGDEEEEGKEEGAAPTAPTAPVVYLSVRRLVLHGNPAIGDAGASALLEAVEGCPSLTAVDLRGASASARRLAEISEAATMNRLRPLLARVRGGSHGHPAGARTAAPLLTALSLRGEGVGDSFMRELAGAIRGKGCALLRLDLGDNPGIGERGAAILTAAISSSSSLKTKKQKKEQQHDAPTATAEEFTADECIGGSKSADGHVSEAAMAAACAASTAASEDAAAAGITRTNATLVHVALDGTNVGAALQRLVLERCVANKLKGTVAALRRGEGGVLLEGGDAEEATSKRGDDVCGMGKGRHAVGAPAMGASVEVEEYVDEVEGSGGKPPPPPPRRLTLRAKSVGAELGAKLGAALRGNCAVRVCDLRGNGLLGNRGATALARTALRPPPPAASEEANLWDVPSRGSWLTLRVLNLRECRVGDAGAASLARALGASPLPHLTVLNLRANLLTDTACGKFAKVFKPPKKVVNDTGGVLYGGPEKLETPTLLRVLNLRDNTAITDEGVAKLGRALSMNESLTELKMRGCGCTNEAKGYVAQGLCVSMKQLLQWW